MASSFDTKNLLYLSVAFLPTSTYKKSSFIDFHCYIDSKPYHISLSRDCMGIGWIQPDKPFPKNGKITRFNSIPLNYDQTFSSWFFLQLQICRRSGRHHVITSLLQGAIDAVGDESTIICIPRVAIFKEPSGALKYQWEIIDGRHQEIVADHIGDPGQLLTEEFAQRRLLEPPQRVGKNAEAWQPE